MPLSTVTFARYSGSNCAGLKTSSCSLTRAVQMVTCHRA
jgi:hypothetical protein